MTADQIGSGICQRYCLGDRWITPSLNEIDGVRIEPKTMDVLIALIEAAPGVISAQALLERAWPGVVVVDNVVYQTIAQLRKALGDEAHAPRYIATIPRRGYRLIAAVTREASVARASSIVVLPLSNISADPEHEHFVDGLTIELIHRLSRIPNLRVAGHGASFAYKKRPETYAEIGHALGVAHLLEGSVRRSGASLRITVALVSTANGFQIWSADFDRQLDDIFAIQREISEAVAEALSGRFRGASLELLGSTSSASAQLHYLRGLALIWRHTVETTERAIAESEAAIALDPGFARAWALLAQAYGARARQPERTEESLRNMVHAAERALQIEPLLWRAHAAMGWYLLSRRQFVAADAAMQEASRLSRAQESVVGPEITHYLPQVGRWSECLEEVQHFQSGYAAFGANHNTLYVLERKEEAHSVFARLKGLSQDVDGNYLSMLAMDQPCAEAADRIVEGFSKTPLGLGWFGPSDEVLQWLRQRLALGNPVRAEFVYGAMIAAHHGDIDLAIDFLRAEYLVDGFGALFLIWWPQLRQVRASPKFKTFLIDLGLPEMWRRTGLWGDFCEPVGEHDFRCR